MTSPRPAFLALALLLAAAIGPAAAASFADAAAPLPLLRAYGKTPFRFGYLTVPENRSLPASRTIQLAVVILPAKTPASPPAPPVFFLTGGPGGSATTDALYFEVFPALQNTHDVVLIDQRGTGYSAPFLSIARGATYASARRDFQNRGIDVTAYNTTENAADIADLRLALGYPEVILFGNSYGTFLAQEVMRSHPAGIAGVVLNGILPAPDAFIPSFNRNTLHGLEALFRDVRRTRAARHAYPEFSRTYFNLLRRLRERPLRMDDGFKVTLDDLQFSIVAMLQSPERIRLIPLLVREVAARRGSDFVRRYFSFGGGGPRGFADGMYLSVLGADWNQPGWLDLTLRRNAALQPAIFRQANAASSLSVVYGVLAWDVPYRPLATRTALQSAIPTLLLRGAMEAQTPADGARLVAAGLPNSFTLAVPRSGHITGLTPGPALQAIVQFAAAPTRRPTVSLASLRRPNFYATRVPERRALSAEPERPLRFLR